MTNGLAAIDASVAAIFVGLVAVAVRRRSRPGATPAVALWAVCAAVSAAVALARIDVLSPEGGLYAVIVGWIVAVPLWAAFAFAHTGRGPAVTRRRIAFVAAYVVVVGASAFGVGISGVAGQLLRVASSLLQTAMVAAGLFGVFLLVRSAVTYDDLPTRQAVALSIGGSGISLYVFSLTAQQVTGGGGVPAVTTALGGVIGLTFGVAVVGYHPFEDVPGTGPLARATILDAMSGAVVVVDRDGRIVDANTSAEETLGVTLTRHAGRPASEVLGYDLDTVAGETTTVPTPSGRRTVAVSRSSLRDRRGEQVGTSYLLRDVTDRQTRQERLEVLDRVLRHNLRNDLDAIRGFAEALSEGAIEDPEGAAERIRGTASGLVEVGETIERADRLATRESLDVDAVDPGAVAESVAADLRTDYDCRITITSDDGATIATDRAVLRTAIREVVENAVEHGDGAPPTAQVAVTETDTGARIDVRDDGPGIPDRERAVVLEGDETPLRHGRGVGLWVVSWAVTRLGGTLDFADEESGSVVRLDVPDRATE